MIRSLVKGVRYFGKLFLCHPTKSFSQPIFGYEIPINFSSIFHICMSIAQLFGSYYFFAFLTPVFLDQIQGKRSGHISFYVLVLSYFFEDLFIRLSTVFYSKEILSVFKSLLSFGSLTGCKLSSRKKLYVLLTSLSLVLTGEFIFYNGKSDLEEESFTNILSENHKIRWAIKLGNFSLSLLSTMFTVYSLLFIIFVGIGCISWYEATITKLERILEKTSSSNPKGVQEGITTNVNLEAFVHEFTEVKKCLEDYCKVAGSYSFAILSTCTITLIIYFNDKIASRTTIPSDSNLYQINFIIMILLISSLGNYLTSTINNERDKLGNVLAKVFTPIDSKLIEITKWVLSWQWKFSALNLFPVNYGIILKIVASILTYLMFFFQLQILDENDKVKLEVNKTDISNTQPISLQNETDLVSYESF